MFDGVLTEQDLLDALKEIERESERFRTEGYRVTLRIWQWRLGGWKGLPNAPEDTIVAMAEAGPMVIYPQEVSWQNRP